MRFQTVVLAAATLLATSPASARQQVETIVDPVWASRPSRQALTNYYPMQAMRNEKTGVGIVRCIAKANGFLTACETVCESPSGYTFGKAARKIALRSRLQPTLSDGRSVAGMAVIIPAFFHPDWLPQPARCDQPT